MPIYEYRCHKCENVFEEIQKITAEPKATCPKCGSTDTQRLVSQTSFILKGTGWYATDNPPQSRHASSATGGEVREHLSEKDVAQTATETNKEATKDGNKEPAKEVKKSA